MIENTHELVKRLEVVSFEPDNTGIAGPDLEYLLSTSCYSRLKSIDPLGKFNKIINRFNEALDSDFPDEKKTEQLQQILQKFQETCVNIAKVFAKKNIRIFSDDLDINNGLWLWESDGSKFENRLEYQKKLARLRYNISTTMKEWINSIKKPEAHF